MAIKVQGITVIDDGRNIINGIGASFTGIVTATTFSGSGANLTSIPNSGLSNSSVNYGGVSLALGGSDATPAFNLSDATNYPTSSLSGTITNDQLAGSIADGKLASTFLKNVVEDTTPQLGGNLDINGKFITGTGGLNVSGVVTTTKLHVGVDTGFYNEDLVVTGDTRITGILTIGTASITLDPNAKTLTGLEELQIGSGATAITIKKSETTGDIVFSDVVGNDSSVGIGTTVNINTTGIITATTFSGSGASLTSIPNGALTNSSIDIGGLTLNLGDTDATPAFDLSDATAYPYTSLTGITTEIVGDTTPQLGGNLDLNSKFITGTGGVNVTGVVTATSFVGNVTGNADTATSLATARTFELTGDVVASQISFDGTGNVSLAATIQPNSVALGGDTTGDYVESISGTGNQITVTSGTGEGSTPVISIPNNPTLPGTTVTVATDLQVNRNLNVTGNVTIGGTSATLFTETLKISDPDIIVGFRTDANGNDISNDTTASHGGIAIASTEGSPLVSFVGGGGTIPVTYKKIFWFESGAFTGLATDAWLTNYAFGVGTTSMSAGTKFAVGNIETDFDDITSVRHINSSGVVTATTFSGSGASLTSIPNGALTNSSIAIGGVTLNLGDTDATPAFNLSDATAYPTSSLVGTITNAQLAGSIANAKLANSSIAIGGVTLNLGDTDATPAFNLSDATAYPYTSLTGITTEIVGDTTPQLGGNLDLNSKFITGTGGINVSGVITSTTFSGSGASLTSIPNGALTNSSIAIGGVTLNLGDTDATPAFNLSDATAYPTSSLVGTITNAQLAGSIANAKLANSTMSVGGVTLTLGATDATPAFDLSDATAYPYTSLTGITTEIVGDTSPQLGGNLDFNSKFITGTGGINVSGVVTATTFSGNLPTTDLTGTITNAQLAGSIANAKLANSSIAIGGVTLNLGDTDTTPAFNLSDATAYPYTSLTGITTEIVGDTTPQLGGNLDFNSKFITGTGGINVSGVVTATTFSGNLPTTDLTGTITNAQLAGSIANAKLTNDSVSFGGVSLDLGGSDATPAFNLSDATDYPTSSLSGTITNAQLAGSIADAKLASTFLKNVVEDTTPQLGGNLDFNSKFITGTGGINVSGVVTATSFSGSGSALTGLTGASAATYGDSSATPVIVVDSNGRITGISTVTISGGSGGGDTVSITTTAADILSVSSGAISADDAGADKIVFWDDSEGKLTYLTVGTNLSISGTTISASGGGGSGPDPVIMGMIF